jgi:hypothetical protein
MFETTSEVSNAINEYSSEKDNKKRLKLAIKFYNKTHSFIKDVADELSKLKDYYELWAERSSMVCFITAAAIFLLNLIISKTVKGFVGLIVTNSILAPLLIASAICMAVYAILRNKMLNLTNELKASKEAFDTVTTYERCQRQRQDQEPITVAPPLVRS